MAANPRDMDDNVHVTRSPMGSSAPMGGMGNAAQSGMSNVRVVRPAPAPIRQDVDHDMRHETRTDVHTDMRERHVEIPEAYNIEKDRVRFGPIVAGLLTAMGSLLLLGLLGAAIGLTAINAGDAARAGGPPAGTGPGAAMWAAFATILSFLLGGYVAGRTAAVFDRKWGAINGAMVFLLGIPLALWLAGQGFGFLVGTLGTFADAVNVDPNTVNTVANQTTTTAPPPRDIDVARAAEGARNAAWGTLLGSLLSLGAAAFGGWLGTRRDLEVEEPVTHVRQTRMDRMAS
jgi:hypothetical protein